MVTRPDTYLPLETQNLPLPRPCAISGWSLLAIRGNGQGLLARAARTTRMVGFGQEKGLGD